MSNQNLLTFANIVIFVILREKFCIILARKAHMEIDVMRDAMIVIIIFNCTCIIGHVTFFFFTFSFFTIQRMHFTLTLDSTYFYKFKWKHRAEKNLNT